jgi:hydroxyacylglutathione hydrolase
MYFQQIVRSDIGCAGYLVGSASGDAAVIDSRIDMVDEVLSLLAREKLRLRYIIETHNHADHVSGHHALAARTGAEIAVHEAAGVAYPHRPLRDGEELALGEVRLRVIHTPGHRPEHIAVAVTDTTRGDLPWLVLTGDSLFIGDVARPDLAVPGEEGATALYRSLRERLLALPDGTMVYPGHVSGSLCGRVTSRMTATTVGFERAFNPALSIDDEAEFVRYTTESLPERPPNMARIVDLNKGAEPPLVGEALPLSASESSRLRSEGVLSLDVRAPEAFAEGHVPGAISVQIDGAQFPTRVGLTLPAEADLVLVAESEEQARQAVTALSVIGHGHVLGYLEGGMPAWEQAGFVAEQLAQLAVSDLREQRAAKASEDVLILDVREHSEWEEDHIPGSLNVPFYHLSGRRAALNPAQPIAIICATGHRSTIAASLLQAAGFKRVYNVMGGMAAWNTNKTKPAAAPTGRR